jgi:GcrA cell cycle regulator
MGAEASEMTTWTDDRVEKLMALWKDGHSANQIVSILGGGLTRNSVLGKIHRIENKMGIPHRNEGKASAPGPAKPRRQRPSMPKAEAAPKPKGLAKKTATLLPSVPAPPLPTDRVYVWELGSKECKWPIGDPGTAEFTFCAHPQREGSVYCDYHTRMAYEPQRTKASREK